MRFLFDAQMPLRLAKGLEMLDKDNLANIQTEILHADDVCGQGATDDEVINKAAEVGAIIVSEDDDFKRIKANKKLIQNLNVGYVLYKPPKKTGIRYWEKTVAFILAWEKLKEKILSIDTPFVLKIDRKGNIQQEL